MAEARAIMQYEHHCVDDLVGFIKEEGLQERVRYAPFNDGAFSLYVTPVSTTMPSIGSTKYLCG